MTRMREHPNVLGGIGSFDRQQDVDDRVGFFAISGTAVIPASTVDGHRCDVEAYGPYGFHTWDAEAGVCSCGSLLEPDSDMGHHVLTLDAVSYVVPVVDVHPHGYILYFEVHDPEVEFDAFHLPQPDCAKTLQELLRLMWEWDQSYELFDNRDPVAVTCHNMIAEMTPPPEVLQWVEQDVPEQAVARYLRGSSNAHNRVHGVPPMGELPDEWITELMQRPTALGHYRAT